MYSKDNPRTSRDNPESSLPVENTHAAFSTGKPFPEKKTNLLPAMGWNSWNAFGTGNTEALTKLMADKLLELGLDKLGYKYLVLDDGCYFPERIDGRLSNETVKFPSGFRALADYIHSKNLKFGMYNDIGTNLCAGSAVGTCGYEDLDAQSYAEWDIDFLKVDNCYYLWDNATFSNKENARYSYAPNIKSVKIQGTNVQFDFDAVKDGTLLGLRAEKTDDFVTKIGTFDGTNTGTTPVGDRFGELAFEVEVQDDGEYSLFVEYASGKEEGCGQWLQVAVGEEKNEIRYFDQLLPETASSTEFRFSDGIKINLKKGKNLVRLMNHRRQENVLASYGAMFYGLQKAKPGNNIILSICEWGKTHPQNWGYKVGNSWRILNDITFNVGADGNPGKGEWGNPGTQSIASQYNKAVVMDEFAGLEKGWNDPDMMVIGMDGITTTMSKTHMTMWCMMNSPLMLGLDLRRVSKGDEFYNIIANADAIKLNQDGLGIQAKRIWSSLEADKPDTTYITNNDRTDILVKPLENGDFALSFINLSDNKSGELKIDAETILKFAGSKMKNCNEIRKADSFKIFDIWTKESSVVKGKTFCCKSLEPYDSWTIRVSL